MLSIDPLIKLHLFIMAGTSLLALTAANVYADQPLVADRAAVEACLALVQKNQESRGPHDPDELTEKSGAAGRLNAAQNEAHVQAESCIRVVYTACIQAEGNMSTAAMSGCYARETAVWDARLNAAYKKLLANGDGPEVAEGFRKVQRNWLAFRDASCAQPALVFQGTMAVPIQGYCQLNMTAHQALWLEGWLR
jgi:uncharacterized protein YecT (DUF1311 family)